MNEEKFRNEASVRRMVSIEAGSDVRTFSHHYDGPLRIFVNDDCVYDSEEEPMNEEKWKKEALKLWDARPHSMAIYVGRCDFIEGYLAGRRKGQEEIDKLIKEILNIPSLIAQTAKEIEREAK